MDRYLKFIFLFFVSVIFLLEGLGINNGREVAYLLILLMPFFLFIPQLLLKTDKKILFPLKFSVLWLLFIAFSLLSSILSVNLQNSFQSLFLYISLFLVFIFAFNNKEILKNLIVPIVFVLGFMFSIFSLFINFFVGQNSIFSIPIDLVGQGDQFIYSMGDHNHLGDFLLLPLAMLIFWFSGQGFKLKNLLLLLFFLPYFIFSYSRSAYLDLILVTLFIFYYFFKFKQRVGKSLIPYSLFFILVMALIVFLFAVPTDTKKPTLLNSFNIALQQKFNLSPGKMFYANRNVYATEGLFSLANRPLFGVGPGNFEYASQKYMNNPLEFASTTHNLFFDVFVENGVFAGIVFLTLFLLILSNINAQLGKSKNQDLNTNNVLFIFLFLGMLLNFQTDYTYLIHSFFLLFFVIVGLIYEETTTIKQFSNLTIVLLSIFLFLIFNLTILSNIAISKGNYLLAFYSYPLNKDVYPYLINRELVLGHKSSVLSHLSLYTTLFSGDPDALNYAGNVHYAYGKQKEAIVFYERGFDANNFEDPILIKKIYEIKLNAQGEKKAKEFADKYFSKLSKAVSANSLYGQRYYQYRLSALNVCKGVYGGNCPYAF